MQPTLWIGPAGSGKLRAARAAIGVPVQEEPHLRTLEFGDYVARYWEFTTHMEIDIMDLSMKDKEILPELLTQLLSTREVCTGARKMMIMRRAHALSPAAAARVRACFEELVWAPNAPAMIWMTARVVNSVVLSLYDGFVYRRVEGAPGGIGWDRALVVTTLGAIVNAKAPVPTIHTYIADMIRQMAFALDEGPPTLAAATWIRERVYDLLGLMITGSELVAGLTWATVRLAAAGGLDTPRAKAVLGVLARARWVPSYRTPIMLELIVAAVYDALATAHTTSAL